MRDALQRQAPTCLTVQKTGEVSQSRCFDRLMDVPVERQRIFNGVFPRICDLSWTQKSLVRDAGVPFDLRTDGRVAPLDGTAAAQFPTEVAEAQSVAAERTSARKLEQPGRGPQTLTTDTTVQALPAETHRRLNRHMECTTQTAEMARTPCLD